MQVIHVSPSQFTSKLCICASLMPHHYNLHSNSTFEPLHFIFYVITSCLFLCMLFLRTISHNINAFISLHLLFPYMYLSQHHHQKNYNNNSTIVNPTPYNKKGRGRGQGGINTSQGNWSQQEMDAMENSKGNSSNNMKGSNGNKGKGSQSLPTNITWIRIMRRWWP